MFRSSANRSRMEMVSELSASICLNLGRFRV